MRPITAPERCARDTSRSPIRARRPARVIRWCAGIQRPGAMSCSSAGVATAMSSGSSWKKAKPCSTNCGATPRSPSSPGLSNGEWATYWCGTTAVRCTGATRSTPARGASCTARRSGLLRNQGAQPLDAVAIDAEVAPPQARGRAYVDHAAVVEKLHVVHIAQKPRPELGVEVVRVGRDDARARHRLDGFLDV